MKILTLAIDCRMIHHSGIGTYLQNILPYLIDSYQIFLLGDKKQLADFSWFPKVEYIQLTVPIYSVKEQIHLPLKIPKVDLFWSPHFNVPILPITAPKRVVTIHDVFHLTPQNPLSPIKKLYARLLFFSAIHKSQKIFTVSEFSKGEIIKYTHAPQKKIVVIHNSINKTIFNLRPDLSKLEETISNFNLPEKFILFVGNIKPHKNLENLLLGFEIFAKSHPEYSLVLAGKQEGFISDNRNIFQIIKQKEELYNKVRITGFISSEELVILYHLAQLFIFPSFYEGFGLPPLEAMACGCPTVVSNIDSLAEVCGDGTYYIDPHKPDDIADAIKTVLENRKLREGLITKGIKRIATFDWQSSAQKYIETLQNI